VTVFTLIRAGFELALAMGALARNPDEVTVLRGNVFMLDVTSTQAGSDLLAAIAMSTIEKSIKNSQWLSL
jgi:hypothetical protein